MDFKNVSNCVSTQLSFKKTQVGLSVIKSKGLKDQVYFWYMSSLILQLSIAKKFLKLTAIALALENGFRNSKYPRCLNYVQMTPF